MCSLVTMECVQGVRNTPKREEAHAKAAQKQSESQQYGKGKGSSKSGGKGAKSYNHKGYNAWRDEGVASGAAKRLLRDKKYPEGFQEEYGSPPAKGYGKGKGPEPPRQPPPPELTVWIDYSQQSSGWQDNQYPPVWVNTWRGWETTLTRW